MAAFDQARLLFMSVPAQALGLLLLAKAHFDHFP